jgi:hypothetical protein
VAEWTFLCKNVYLNLKYGGGVEGTSKLTMDEGDRSDCRLKLQSSDGGGVLARRCGAGRGHTGGGCLGDFAGGLH